MGYALFQTVAHAQLEIHLKRLLLEDCLQAAAVVKITTYARLQVDTDVWQETILSTDTAADGQQQAVLVNMSPQAVGLQAGIHVHISLHTTHAVGQERTRVTEGIAHFNGYAYVLQLLMIDGCVTLHASSEGGLRTGVRQA